MLPRWIDRLAVEDPMNLILGKSVIRRGSTLYQHFPFSDQLKMSVVVDALAFLRIFKTCVDSHPDLTTGILVGAEDADTVIISNGSALPNEDVAATPEAEAVTEPLGDYKEEYMETLTPINGDLNVIGLFFAGNVGSVLTEANLQKVYELQAKNPSAVLLTLDLPAFKALRSSVRAFRLTDSMMAYFKSNVIPASGDQAVVELSVKLTVPVLLDSFISENLPWVQNNAKGPHRLPHYLERNLEILSRSIEVSGSGVEKFLQAETARLLRSEAVKAARALLEI